MITEVIIFLFFLIIYYVLKLPLSELIPQCLRGIATSPSLISKAIYVKADPRSTMCRWPLTHPGTHNTTWTEKLAHQYISLEPVPLFLAFISNISFLVQHKSEVILQFLHPLGTKQSVYSLPEHKCNTHSPKRSSHHHFLALLTNFFLILQSP